VERVISSVGGWEWDCGGWGARKMKDGRKGRWDREGKRFAWGGVQPGSVISPKTGVNSDAWTGHIVLVKKAGLCVDSPKMNNCVNSLGNSRTKLLG